MKSYFCYVYRDAGDIPHFEVVTGSDDNDARLHALNLLKQRPAHHSVEVWEDRRRLGAFDRDGLAVG